jgi:DNA-binding transcriptional ArsR family regulator
VARDAAAVVLHPVRLRIVQAVAGRRLTAAELAAALGDVPQATLYRHIGTLLEAGVLSVAAERRVRGATERTYVLAAGGGDLSPADLATAARDDHLRYFAVFVAGLLGDFGRYLDAGGGDLLADGVGYRQVPLELSDQELAELAGRLNAAVAPALHNTPAPGRRRRMFTTILMPADPPAPPPV